jgi:hypothetical protein
VDQIWLGLLHAAARALSQEDPKDVVVNTIDGYLNKVCVRASSTENMFFNCLLGIVAGAWSLMADWFP